LCGTSGRHRRPTQATGGHAAGGSDQSGVVADP